MVWPAVIAGGAAIGSALLARGAARDQLNAQEDAMQLNFEAQQRAQEEQERVNAFMQQLATASTTNLRGDRTFYDEHTGWGIDPSQFTANAQALTDGLTTQRLEAAGPIQGAALDARTSQQQGENRLANSLLARAEARDPLTATQVMNAENTQSADATNQAYDASIEALMGRMGNVSSVGPMINQINAGRANTIRDQQISLPEASSRSAQLDASEASNLGQQYELYANRGAATVPIGADPGSDITSALMSGRNLAPQTLGQMRTPIIPQQGYPTSPDFSDALAVGSIGNAASGAMAQYQSNQQWQTIMDALMSNSGNGQTPLYGTSNPNSVGY